MSDNALNEEDKEVELGSYTLEDKYKLSSTSPRDNTETETESDLSTDSSSTSRKQLKSPHTLLKNAPSENPERRATSSQNDQAEHYERLLQEAQQSLSSRDILIAMLQEQLRKIENLYKKSLDDTQDLRHKYCVTTQDLSNLRTICEKYKEDIDILTKKEKNENDSKKHLEKLQKEVEHWKAQYNNLLKQVQVMENEITGTAKKISQEIQVDVLENQGLRTDVNILKDYCVSIKKSLQEQNKKVEFLVRKLQEEMQQPDNEKHLKQELINTENESVKITEQPMNLKEDKVPQIDNKLYDSEKMMQSSYLKNELENLKLEIKQLNKKNAQLQSEIHDIDKLKKEIKKLNSQLCNDEFAAPFNFTSSPVDVKDSMLENLKNENIHLRGELNALKNTMNPSLDASEDCESNNEPTDTKDCAQQERHRQASRVSFAVTDNHLESELLQLQQENSELKLKIKELQGGNTDNNEIERLNVELLDVNTKLARDLKMKSCIIYEETNSNQNSCKEAIPEVNNNTEYKEAHDEIKPELNNKAQEPNTITYDPNKNMTDIIKEAVVQSICTEMEKLKATLCNTTECEMVIKENHKIKDELNGKTKQLETIQSNLETKTVDIIQKETIIASKTSEIEQLKRKINENNLALQDRDKIKNEFENTRKEIQDLQATISVLKANLSKALQENENNNKDLECHKACKGNIKKLEDELADLKEKLPKENEALKSQIIKMTNTMQQYREEAEFKKLENEKLRIKEEQLQSAMSSMRRNSDYIAREYHKELEKNKISLSDMSKECNKLCQTKLNKVNDENGELKKLLQQKDEQTKTLTDKINTITQELDETKSLHQKHLDAHERSLSEIKFLFKNKEDEVISAVNELQKYQENLQILEEENERLQKLLQENIKEQENKEYSLKLKQTMELKILEENYNNEKLKNRELDNILNNIRKEVQNLKMQIQDLLKNLEYKLKLLKKDLLCNKCNVPASKRGVNELLDYIENFNTSMLQRQLTTIQNDNNDSITEETEHYSYYYEDTNNVTMEDNIETFACTVTDCKKINTTNNIQNQSPNAIISKNLRTCNQDFPSMTIKELQIKSEHLIQKPDSIDQKLNNPDYLSVIKTLAPKCIPSSESVSTSHTKNSDKDSFHTCPQTSDTETEDLLCEHKHDSEKMNVISEEINTDNSKNYETYDNTKNVNNCSSITCTSSGKNSEVKQQMASDLYGTKTDDTINVNNCCSISCTSSSKNSDIMQQIVSVIYETKIDDENNCSSISCISSSKNSEIMEQMTSDLCRTKIGDAKNINNSSSMSCSSSENSEIMQQMASDLYRTKIESTTQGQNKSLKDHDFEKCPCDSELQLHIKDLLEQLACSVTDDVDDVENQLQAQQPKLENFQVTPQLEIDANKSYSKTIPSTAKEEENNKESLPDLNTKEVKCCENTIECSKSPGCSTQQPIPTHCANDALVQKSCNTLREIKEESHDNKSYNTATQQNKKCSAHTAIPVLIKCPNAVLKNTSKTKNSNIIQKQSKISDHKIPMVSQLSTEATQSSCACWKRNPCGTSSLPISGNLSKNCSCSSGNKKDNPSLSENVKYSGYKIVKSCKCRDSSKHLKD